MSLTQQVQLAIDTFQQLSLNLGEEPAFDLISKSVVFVSIGSNDFIHYYLQNQSMVQSLYLPWEFNQLLIGTVKLEMEVNIPFVGFGIFGVGFLTYSSSLTSFFVIICNNYYYYYHRRHHQHCHCHCHRRRLHHHFRFHYHCHFHHHHFIFHCHCYHLHLHCLFYHHHHHYNRRHCHCHCHCHNCHHSLH